MLGRSDAWAKTLVYGAAHYGKSLFWYGGEVLFAFFLTEVADLDPADMAAVLAIGFLLSAVFDFKVGWLMSRGLAGMRRAGRLQALGAVLSGIALIGFFATPMLPEPLRIAWALCAGIAFRFAFSIYDIPQGALTSIAAVGDEARSRVAVVRIFGSGLAALTVAAAVAPLIIAERAGGGGAVMMTIATGAAVFATITALALWRLVAGEAAPPDVRRPTQLNGAGRTLAGLWPLLAMMMVMMLGPPLFQKLEPYFATRSFASATLGGAIVIAAALGVCCGQPIWLRCSAQQLRVGLFITGAALQAGGALLFLIAPLSAPALLIIGAWMFGLGNGGLGMAKWASFSDVAARSPPHLQGLCFAAFAATGKISLAAGAILVALAVSAGEGAPERLRWVMTAGPLLASICMALLTFRRPHCERGSSIGNYG